MSNDEKKEGGIEAPQLSYVKGGTPTSKSEKHYEERFQEAEARRNEDARERKEAADAKALMGPDGKPVMSESGGVIKMPGHVGGGVDYRHKFTDNPEIPEGKLHFTYHEGLTKQIGEGYAELLQTDPDRPDEMVIVMVCAMCQKDSHKHMQDNQIRVRRSHKWFEHRLAGPTTFWLTDDDTGLTTQFRSAGIITESEPFRCPDCGRRMRIDMNRVIYD